MVQVHLYIPDLALQEAVGEQIAVAKLGEARVASSLAALLKQSAGQSPCVALIDTAACDKKGMALLADMAARPEKPFLLFLGEVGEDDPVTESFAKPFRLGHLVARLRYYLETATGLRETTLAFGPYRLEAQNRRVVRRDDEAIRLTEKETALLVFLAQSAAPVTRADILAAVWGYDERIDTHTLETHIYQLRRKLDGGGENWLVNEAGAYHLARGDGA